MADDPKKLARTLLYLVEKGHVPGLLPDDVLRAAAVLLEQEKELTTLRTALAAKKHVVEAKSERQHYRQKITGTFIITDPRIYYGEITVDDLAAYHSPVPDDWMLHVARQLTRVATADWIKDLEERAYVAVRAASADTRPELTGANP